MIEFEDSIPNGLTLVQVIPANVPMWAVLVADDGTPDVRPVACLATYANEEKGFRCVAAHAVGRHPSVADFRPDFVSLASSPDPLPWVEACRDKLAEVRAKQREKAQQKIIVPNNGVVQPFRG